MGNILTKKTNKQDPHSYNEVKNKENYFVELVYFNQLIDECVKDTKQSALSTGKWSDKWEASIKKSCKDKISTVMFVEIIKEKHPELYAKAFEEAKM